jgi:hypothetical protein
MLVPKQPLLAQVHAHPKIAILLAQFDKLVRPIVSIKVHVNDVR